MLKDKRLPVRTAKSKDSVWRWLPEDQLRRHMVALERVSNGIPDDARVHSIQSWQSSRAHEQGTNQQLPLLLEQRLADDLAFVAAAEENVKMVSAVAIEERVDTMGLVITLATNDVVSANVSGTLRSMLLLLKKCAGRRLSRDACTMELFDCVMKLCEGRIHGRLQSAQWKRPAHRNNDPREPLFVDLFKTLKTLRGLSSSSSANSDDLLQELKSLSETYQAIDNGVGDPIETTLKVRNAVRKSYDICTKDGTCSLEETIRSYGFNASLICQSKAMRQVNKIGRYWGLCVDMPEDSRRYRVLFENVILQCPLPYRTVPTSISYKTSRKQLLDCHVHAEIQLVISYDKEDPRETLKPRAIGVSKAACYLCNLFIRTHGHFFITKTHGQLYDQWTIPDLSTYTSQQRDHYRQILKSMDAKIQADIPRQPKRKRQGHAGSWLSLSTTLKKSTLPSDAGTILSDRSIGTFEPLLSGPVTPGASPPPAPSAQSPGLPTPPASLVQSLYPLQKTLTPSESSVSAIPAVLSTRLTPKSSTPALEPVAHLPSPTDSVHSMPYQPQIKEIPRTNKPNDLTTPPSPPSSISTISLHPLNIPVTRTITAHQFAQFSYAGLHVTIEVEGPCKVEATATQNPNGNAAAPIDVDQMRPGEAIELAGDEGASGMMLLLRHTEVNPPSEPNSMALGLDLRWLS